ncbi:hypothetical protein C0J52_26218 [Blattella germanica]|nr:hypothetical protein C0J52_26218 [Blattella germanica]
MFIFYIIIRILCCYNNETVQEFNKEHQELKFINWEKSQINAETALASRDWSLTFIRRLQDGFRRIRSCEQRQPVFWSCWCLEGRILRKNEGRWSAVVRVNDMKPAVGTYWEKEVRGRMKLDGMLQ